MWTQHYERAPHKIKTLEQNSPNKNSMSAQKCFIWLHLDYDIISKYIPSHLYENCHYMFDYDTITLWLQQKFVS